MATKTLIRTLLLARRTCSGASRTSSSTISQVVREVSARLESSGVPEPELSARHLVAHVTNKTFSRLLRSDEDDSEFPAERHARLETLISCRLSRMPVQYLVGEWDFRQLSSLKLHPPVFIPRPETEELVGLVLEDSGLLLESDGAARAMEIGCGSGAVALSLLREAHGGLRVTAVDQSQAACELTLENAVDNGLEDRLEVVRAKLLQDGTFDRPIQEEIRLDLVVSNPPYVLRKDLARLQPEVTLYEDLRALDGGSDGLDVIRPILRLSSVRLRTGGRLYLEMDPCHFYLLPRALQEADDLANLRLVECRKDFADRHRFAILERTEA